MATKMSNGKSMREDLYIGPKIPQGLTAAIEGLTKEILRQRPEDIYDFAAKHFEKLLDLRKEYEQSEEQDLQESNRQRGIKEIERMCNCKKKQQCVDEATLMQSSGWSLNETAKVLKRYRNIFGDSGKKISLDEIYDLANTKSTASSLPKSKHRKCDKREEKSESPRLASDDSCEEKKVRSDRSKKSSKQKKKMTSEESSFESSTKIKEINYSSETRKTSIEESQSSSYIHKVYEIRETKSVMKEKIHESKHLNGQSPKAAPTAYEEADSFSSGISNKLSKSATCLSKSDGFESKLKETQSLLEKISTNLNESMRRSISAKDLRRVSQSSDYSEPKSTESSSTSKLKQISLPTVRPFSATRSDFLKKVFSNGMDDALTLPIISQRPNKCPKPFDSGLTLPKLSPSNAGVPRAEAPPDNFTIIRDIDKQVIDISENKIEFQQSVNISEKIELKSSPSINYSENEFKDKGRETEERDVASAVNFRYIAEDKKENKKSPSLKSRRSGAKVEQPKSTRSEISSKSSTAGKTKREQSRDKESFGTKRSESARSILNKDTNNEMCSGKAKIAKTKSVDSSGFKIDGQNVRVEKALREKMTTKSIDQAHRCPVHDCVKSLNNDLLKSKLEELVKAEQLILRDREPDETVEETERTKISDEKKDAVGENDTGRGKSSKEKLPSGKSSSKSESEKQTIRSFREEKQRSNDKALNIQQIEDNVFAYILTEGSPCEIPDSVTTVIFADSSARNSTEIEMTVEEIDNQVLTSVFGEQIDYEETLYEPLLSADFKALKNVHDISMLRQDLHRIKEEEEEEENDVSANEDSTIVLDRILQSQQVDEDKIAKDDKESDMSLQEFLLHCTLNESTEEASINDNTDDAVMPFVPELNLKIIEDATESTSKTSHQKSAGGGSVDEIENSVLQSERTLTSNNELDACVSASTHETLTGDQQPTTRDEASLQLDTNLTDSPKSSTSALSQNKKLIRAVAIIQRAFKRYKMKEQAKKEQEQQLINNEIMKIEKKSSLGGETKDTTAKMVLIDQVADAVVKIQKFYRNYKGRTDSCSNVLQHEQKVKSANEISHEKLTKQEEKINCASEFLSEKLMRDEESAKSESMIPSDKSISEEEIVKLASKVLSDETIREEEEIKSKSMILSEKSKEKKVKSASNVLTEKAIKQEKVESERQTGEQIKRDEQKVINEHSIFAMNKMIQAALTIQRYYRKYKIRKSSTTVENEDTTNFSSIIKKDGKTFSIESVSKENSISIDTNKSASANLQNTETLISKQTTKTGSKENDISTLNLAAKTDEAPPFKELTKVDETVLAAIKIQKMYRMYKSTKNKALSSASAKSVLSPSSFQLQHTGEFHDCIPLSVLDFLPKLNRNIKGENGSKSEGVSGDHRRARREWNQNRPVSPSFLYPSGFGKRSMSEGNAGEAANDMPQSNRFPGMMIYADSLKNTYRPRTIQQPVENENFMNFVVFSGEEPVINVMTMKNAQSREVEKEPEDTGVIIEEINNDDDLSQSNEHQ